jgi:hypothetical protein
MKQNRYGYDPKDRDEVAIAKALFDIANELHRRNSIELVDRIKLRGSEDPEERFIAYEAEEDR